MASAEHSPKLAVSITEAAHLSSLSTRTLRTFTATKRLRSFKIGRRRLIRVRDLETFLRADQPSPLPGANGFPRIDPSAASRDASEN